MKNFKVTEKTGKANKDNFEPSASKENGKNGIQKEWKVNNSCRTKLINTCTISSADINPAVSGLQLIQMSPQY